MEDHCSYHGPLQGGKTWERRSTISFPRFHFSVHQDGNIVALPQPTRHGPRTGRGLASGSGASVPSCPRQMTAPPSCPALLLRGSVRKLFLVISWCSPSRCYILPPYFCATPHRQRISSSLAAPWVAGRTEGGGPETS